MRRILCSMAVLLLALPALRADDKPKDDPKPQTPKERYDALVKDFSTQQRQILAEAQKAKGDEQQKVFQKYFALGKDFADKFAKLAEEAKDDPVAIDVAFWLMQNAAGTPAAAKAADKVKTVVGEMPLKDLTRKLSMMRGGTPALMEAVLKRAEKDEKDAAAGDLLAWVASNGYYLPIGMTATEKLVEKFPDHPAIQQICAMLSRGNSPKATEVLKQILEKSSKPAVKAAAALSLGQALAAQTDKLGDKPAEADKVAAEAEKYFTRVIDEFSKDQPALKKQAEKQLHALRTLRVGKEAPDIKGPDLDEKDFKLSDYRGKVVLLDFWGNW